MNKPLSWAFKRPVTPINPGSSKIVSRPFMGPYVTQRQINIANNPGYWLNTSTGLPVTDKYTKQLFPGKKTIFNDPLTRKNYLDKGISRLFVERQNPHLNFPKIGPLSKDMYEPYISSRGDLTKFKKYEALKKNAIDAAHPLMHFKTMYGSRDKLPSWLLPYVEHPSFLTTGFRNKSYHKAYEKQLDTLLNAPFDPKAGVGKFDLVKQFNEGKMSKGKFLMANEAIEAKIKNVTRDMRKLGLQSMMFDYANNRFKYYGGLYDNLAQLYKNMGDDYFLRSPGDLNSAYFEKIMGFPKPSLAKAVDKYGNRIPKDHPNAQKRGEGQWWYDRGIDNFGGYWRTKEPYMKNKGSKYNFNFGGLASLIGNDTLQKIASKLSPKELKFLSKGAQ